MAVSLPPKRRRLPAGAGVAEEFADFKVRVVGLRGMADNLPSQHFGRPRGGSRYGN